MVPNQMKTLRDDEHAEANIIIIIYFVTIDVVLFHLQKGKIFFVHLDDCFWFLHHHFAV